jgi:hypothetical protein
MIRTGKGLSGRHKPEFARVHLPFMDDIQGGNGKMTKKGKGDNCHKQQYREKMYFYHQLHHDR